MKPGNDQQEQPRNPVEYPLYRSFFPVLLCQHTSQQTDPCRHRDQDPHTGLLSPTLHKRDQTSGHQYQRQTDIPQDQLVFFILFLQGDVLYLYFFCLLLHLFFPFNIESDRFLPVFLLPGSRSAYHSASGWCRRVLFSLMTGSP